MNDNITYFQTVETRPTTYSNAQPNGTIQYETQQVDYPVSVSQFHTTSSNQFINTVPVSDDRIILQPHQRVIAVNPVTGQQSQIQVVQMQASSVPSSSQPQQIFITTQPISTAHETDENQRLTFTEYFVEPNQQPAIITSSSIYQPQQTSNVKIQKVKQQQAPINVVQNVERTERDQVKRAKQAESARLRYHRLDDIQKKELNLKRTLAQKRKRQREREMAELEAILRQSNDIIDDPEVIDQLREKKMRAKWADAARKRYQKLEPDERRAHNAKRRLRSLTVKNSHGEMIRDEDTVREKIKEKNVKKAEAARQRYHRMTSEVGRKKPTSEKSQPLKKANL